MTTDLYYLTSSGLGNYTWMVISEMMVTAQPDQRDFGGASTLLVALS